MLVKGTPGASPTNDISIEFVIRPKIAVLWFKIYSTDHNKILHTSRQYNCRDVCKISLWSIKHILNKSIPNFDRISNSIEIALVGRAPYRNESIRSIHPWSTSWHHLYQFPTRIWMNSIAPKGKCRHFYKIFFTGCTASCHYGKPVTQISSKWRHFYFSALPNHHNPTIACISLGGHCA